MATGTPVAVPTEGYKANDPDILDAEKEQFIADMKGALKSEVDTAQADATQGIADAAAADAKADQGISDAATAQAKADSSVQLEGDQNVYGKKSLDEIWRYTNYGEQDPPLENQIPAMGDVINECGRSGDGWTTLTLVNGWAGTAKARVDRWGYLELFIDVAGAEPSSNTFATLPSGLRPNFEYMHNGGYMKYKIETSGNIISESGEAYTGKDYVRIPQNQP